MSTTTAAAVHLEIPAQTAFVRVARLTATATAANHGVDAHDLDDLSLAVDEACAALVEHASEGGSIHVEFRPGPLGIDVLCSAVSDEFELDELAASVLRSATDKFDVRRADDRTVIELRKLATDIG